MTWSRLTPRQVVNPAPRPRKDHQAGSQPPGSSPQSLVPASSNPTPTPPTALQLTPRPLLENWTSSSSSASTRYPCRAGNLSEQDKLDALPVGGRLFMDVVRMIAYRAETRMMAPLIGAQGKKPNAAGCCGV